MDSFHCLDEGQLGGHNLNKDFISRGSRATLMFLEITYDDNTVCREWEKVNSQWGIKAQLLVIKHCQPQEVDGGYNISITLFLSLIQLIISPDKKGLYLSIP